MTDDDNADRYERSGKPAMFGDLARTADDFGLPLLGRTPEWWEEQNRRADTLRAQSAANAEISRMTERAGELRDNGFPARAVDAAMMLAGGAPPGGGGGSEPPLDTLAMQRARLFVDVRSHGLRKRLLILAGGVGVGKTTAAAWVALKGLDPRPGFLRASELERRGRYDKALGPWLDERTSLVIDDIGAEVLDGKGVFRSLLDEVIDKFYGHERVLVMTTNLRPRRGDETEVEQFFERYGDRVWSRLSHLGEWGDCGSRDLRNPRKDHT